MIDRNRFHSICPYFAMFPESFAEHWVGKLTKPGDVVLDPFCGRGTTPFQSLLMNRRAVACDVNPVAYCITKAKTDAPQRKTALVRLKGYEQGYKKKRWLDRFDELPEFFHWAFHRETGAQLLYLRDSLDWKGTSSDCMLMALALGCLHGESHKSENFLSNRMPRTISTKPDYSVRFWKERKLNPPERDVFQIIRHWLEYRYQTEPPAGRCDVHLMDMRELPWGKVSLPKSIRCAVTSPPYLNVTSYEEDQWLRLWFLGGETRPRKGQYSIDDRHLRRDRYWDMIADLWRSLGAVLDEKSHVVIRMGGKGLTPKEIVNGLVATSDFSKRRIRLIEHQTTTIKNRQTNSFTPGTTGCLVEVDCHFSVA